MMQQILNDKISRPEVKNLASPKLLLEKNISRKLEALRRRIILVKPHVEIIALASVCILGLGFADEK